MKLKSYFCAAALFAASFFCLAENETDQGQQPESGSRRKPAMHQQIWNDPFAGVYFALMTTPEISESARAVFILHKASLVTDAEATRNALQAEAKKRLADIITAAAKDEKFVSALPQDCKEKLDDPAKLADELIAGATSEEDSFLKNLCPACARPMMPQGAPRPHWDGRAAAGQDGPPRVPGRRNNGGNRRNNRPPAAAFPAI